MGARVACRDRFLDEIDQVLHRLQPANVRVRQLHRTGHALGLGGHRRIIGRQSEQVARSDVGVGLAEYVAEEEAP